jgi:hypothetical protein
MIPTIISLAWPNLPTGVLSTIAYITVSSLTVDAVTFTASYMSQGSATGILLYGGLCDTVPTNGYWLGKVVICKHGIIYFMTKISNVEQSGDVVAVIYNNVPGSLNNIMIGGTFPAITLSMEDGEYIVTNKLGLNGSMCCPHCHCRRPWRPWPQ